MGVFRKSSDVPPRRTQPSPFRATSSGQRRLGATPGSTSPASSSPSPYPVSAGYRDPAPYSQTRPLTAAAVQIKLNDKSEAERFQARRKSAAFTWQQEAWEYYDAIGEIKYAFNLVASVVSRIRLYAAVVEDPAYAPAPLDPKAENQNIGPRLAAAAERAIKRLESAFGGQAGLLKDMALNLQVTGECYLVQVPERIGSKLPETWDIRSTDELSVDSRGNYIVTPLQEVSNAFGSSDKGKSAIVLPSNAFVGRIWRTHPRYTQEADSSMRGLLDLCSELLLLNRTFRATAKSRLNAGALYIPDGLSVAAGPDPGYPYGDEEGLYEDELTPEEAADEFEEQLIDALSTPIKDEESASAVVPLIIRGPADLGDKIKQFKFERSFDPALAERSDRVLERIMQGLDVPKDVVTGLANVKYSNALQIDETLYKAHIEPLMLLIADALTVVYLRPYLKANGFEEDQVNQLVVWYDPSLVATRNDRAADADSGFQKMAVSYDTWRRAHGFSEADAPTEAELGLRLLIEKGAITPELTESLLEAIAPGVMGALRTAQQEASVAPMPQNVMDALGVEGQSPIGPDGSLPSMEPPVPLAEPAPSATPGTLPEPILEDTAVQPREVANPEEAPSFLAEPPA